ncbi:MAG: RodZ domain-containing protein [Pseudomonadota bacterium]
MSGANLDKGQEQRPDTPGAILAVAREAQALTQRDVADVLNLPLHVVEAIDADDKTRLPAHVFTRGYVRAYAKLVGVDPDPLVSALTSDQYDMESVDQRVTEAQVRKPLPLWILAAPVALVLLGLVWFFTGSDAADVPVVDSSTASVEVPQTPAVTQSNAVSSDLDMAEAQPLAEAASVPVQVTNGGPGDLVVAEPSPAVVETTVPVGSADRDDPSRSQSELAIAASVDPGLESAVVDSGAPVRGERRLTDFGEQRLALAFSEDCWVEIKDADGAQLYANLGRAGVEWRFVGAGPFQVLLGYAPGATLRFNEEVVALAPHTRNNVANLVLGQ